MLSLRPYQEEAKAAVYEHLRSRDDNPCVVIPTAGGKTPVMASICRDAVTLWKGRVLILAHVKELLEQAADKLAAICPEVRFGVYSAGLKRRDTDEPVIVAGIQSVYKRACELEAFDLVIIDEAHMIPLEGDGMYRQFLADAKVVNPLLRIIGFTATPFRLKSGSICTADGFLNHVCFEVGVRELIRDGYLCPLITKAGTANPGELLRAALRYSSRAASTGKRLRFPRQSLGRMEERVRASFASTTEGRMKLAALCCTYLRPHTLGQLIESFLRQDYPKEHRELIILDDAGQYGHQEGDGWRLISLPRRFRSLGEKRNACSALASHDVEGFLIADDDDIYLPHWFRTQAEALKRAEWSRPGLVLMEDGGGLREVETGGLYHGGWAFRRSAFDRVRGYGAHNNGEDQELAGRLAAASQCDPCEFAEPFYIYRNDNGSYHLSWMSDNGYQELTPGIEAPKGKLSIGWPRDYAKLPVKRHFALAPHVSHGDGKMRVELIGPVNAPGRDGPTNGMYALQKELRKRIADGLDWLSIKPLPVSDGALPWFWNWQDRRYAAWWDSQGRPFVQGPNMLFTHSGSPRIDREECALLDAANCRAMFCHSEWYRDLIAKHRGPANQSSIVLWPYPIDPWPGPPLPDEYDLLIYAKNGHRPGLLEHLAEVFPRHVQIHYGQYHRQQLFDAARRSRACAYLADDDHGPLALQEILLAGCPTVGVRTGASLVREGVTGVRVDKLPAGHACAKNDRDGVELTVFLNAITRAQSMDRGNVRIASEEEFGIERIVGNILKELQSARTDS